MPSERSHYSGRDDSVTSYFTGKTALYDRFRPGYPDDAIRAILSDLPRDPIVVDVGCGTGISSRALAAQGAHVIGIEPNDDMRTMAANAGTPKGQPVEYRAGTGEQTGLDTACAHAVVCAQSFHWFDAPVALREFHRILKPSGRLALMWNVRDESEPAAAEYERIITRAQAEAERAGRTVRHNRAGDASTGGWFVNIRQLNFGNSAEYDLDSLLGRARSASYWPESGKRREELEGNLRQLFEQFSTNGILRIEQLCSLTLAERTDEVASPH